MTRERYGILPSIINLETHKEKVLAFNYAESLEDAVAIRDYVKEKLDEEIKYERKLAKVDIFDYLNCVYVNEQKIESARKRLAKKWGGKIAN